MKRNHIDCSQLTKDRIVEGDVAIVGTGAGGGIAAQTLAEAGLKVILIEEGPYQTAKDFHMQESEAYPQLYQEVASRKTRDKAINILQGRAVGGGTTVNWTSCFHIPSQSLEYWRGHYGWELTEQALQPWYRKVEAQLHITPWRGHNQSNAVLGRGLDRLNWHQDIIRRNVKQCRGLGYCGTGCPVDAKQSALVTSILAALKRGAVLLSRARAQHLRLRGDNIEEIECLALNARSSDATGMRIIVRTKHVVLAGGGIGSPAVLLRSKIPDPDNVVGKRTFLHVTVGSIAIMPRRIDPYYGAPQSIHSNEFLWRDGVTGEMGYKIETAPLQPVLAATVFNPFGIEHAQAMKQLPFTQPLIALLRDGFHRASPGGTVTLNGDGSPVLDYPLNDYLWRAVRHAYGSLLQIQFAAGARRVLPAHSEATWFRSWSEAQRAIDNLSMTPHHSKLFSAHVMGGCAMGADSRSSVVDLDGNHRFVQNLTIIDGSIFPTSIGANPSLPIYAIAAKLSSQLAGRLH